MLLESYGSALLSQRSQRPGPSLIPTIRDHILYGRGLYLETQQ